MAGVDCVGLTIITNVRYSGNLMCTPSHCYLVQSVFDIAKIQSYVVSAFSH